MSPSPFGLCPICTEELEKRGDLLECPSGDYRALARDFLERWERFNKERVEIPLSDLQGGGRDLVETLLRELQEMNIPRIGPL